MKFRIKGLVILLLVVAVGCKNGHNPNFLGSGTIEADEVFVSAMIAGRIDSLWVNEGDIVEQGQVIAKLDVRKLQEQLHQTEAALEELTINRSIAQRGIDQASEQQSYLQSSLKRQKNLLESGSSTVQMVDDLSTQETMARSRQKAAKEQLEALQAKEKQLQSTMALINLQIADGTLIAPRRGVIAEKYIEIGENVAPGSSVVKIADLEHLWIKVYLAEPDMGKAPLGAKLQIDVDALKNKPYQGKVVWVSPRSEFTPSNIQTKKSRAELVFAVKVAFDNLAHKAMIGMPAEVSLP
jgi:HlyD family secretion protein